jgi:hypothetical protein
MKRCFTVLAAAVLAVLVAGSASAGLVIYDNFTSSSVSSGLWTFSGGGYTIGSGLNVDLSSAGDTEFKMTATSTIPAGTDFTVVVPFTITGTTLTSGSAVHLDIALKDATDDTERFMIAWGRLEDYMGISGTAFATGTDSPTAFTVTSLTTAALGLIYSGTTIQAGYYTTDGTWYWLYTYDISGWGSSALAFDLSAGVEGTASFTGVVSDVSYSAVPIPGALLLFGTGLAGLAAARRRFKK